MSENNSHNDPRYAEAVKRGRHKAAFIYQLFVYIAVNVVLLIINLMTSPDQLWFYWVTIFWGLGLAMQGVRMMGFSESIEKRMVDKEIRREKDKS